MIESEQENSLQLARRRYSSLSLAPLAASLELASLSPFQEFDYAIKQWKRAKETNKKCT